MVSWFDSHIYGFLTLHNQSSWFIKDPLSHLSPPLLCFAGGRDGWGELRSEPRAAHVFFIFQIKKELFIFIFQIKSISKGTFWKKGTKWQSLVNSPTSLVIIFLTWGWGGALAQEDTSTWIFGHGESSAAPPSSEGLRVAQWSDQKPSWRPYWGGRLASVWRDLGAVEEKRGAKSTKSGGSRIVFKVIIVSTRFESGE